MEKAHPAIRGKKEGLRLPVLTPHTHTCTPPPHSPLPPDMVRAGGGPAACACFQKSLLLRGEDSVIPPTFSHAARQEQAAPSCHRVAIPVPCALQRCCTWWSSTWRRGSLTKKPSPSLTWRRQDTSTKTNGKRSPATVPWHRAGAVCVPAEHRAWVRGGGGMPGRMVGPAGARARQAVAEQLERPTWWQ